MNRNHSNNCYLDHAASNSHMQGNKHVFLCFHCKLQLQKLPFTARYISPPTHCLPQAPLSGPLAHLKSRPQMLRSRSAVPPYQQRSLGSLALPNLIAEPLVSAWCCKRLQRYSPLAQLLFCACVSLLSRASMVQKLQKSLVSLLLFLLLPWLWPWLSFLV